ncbi:TPA: 9-O-acetyl-N-acetylneuraminic acid deacetylase, partial [Escherichia coli]|nr:9-O-acetyl-N-acetylneuraminic acid deacetylase [Escherichia coli]
LLTRTQAALKANPKNILLAVVWMQGEFDLKQGAYATQPGLFDSMVEKYRSDLSEFGGQCLGGSPSSVPWICGDTTYYWKQTYSSQYDAVYGAYKTKSAKKIFFVPFMTDENGRNVGTNEPS